VFNPALQEIVSILNKVFNAPHQEIRKALGRISLNQFIVGKRFLTFTENRLMTFPKKRL